MHQWISLIRQKIFRESAVAVRDKLKSFKRNLSKWRIFLLLSSLCNLAERLLLKFRRRENHSELSRPYFEPLPLTFVKLRFLLKREYFDLNSLTTFSSSILTLFAYIFINSKKRIFHW